ncbi:MAG: porin [Pseudomonadota bacterium]
MGRRKTDEQTTGRFLAPILVFAAPSLLSLKAMAQPVGDRLQVEPIASVTVVLAPGFDGTNAADGMVPAQAGLGEISLGARAEYIFDSGVELGGRLVWRVQRDHPDRPGGTGSPIQGAGDVAGVFSGLSSAGSSGDVGPRGSVESAFIYLRGGYGEVSAGRDTGVAARFFEGNVDVFTLARGSDSRLDVSGLNIVRTRADLTGPSTKITYTTPRILGLRGGVSYTPEANAAGLDRNLAFSADGVDRPDIADAWEVALNASRRFRDSGVRVRAGAGYASASVDRSSPTETLENRVNVASIGGEISRGPVAFGASLLSSNDGSGDGDYTAWSVGAAYEWRDWTGSLNFGRAEANLPALDGEALSAGISREVGKYGTFTFGYQDIRASSSADAGYFSRNRAGLVIELSLSL